MNGKLEVSDNINNEYNTVIMYKKKVFDKPTSKHIATVQIVHFFTYEQLNGYDSKTFLLPKNTWNVEAYIFSNAAVYNLVKDVKDRDIQTADERFGFDFHCEITLFHKENDNCIRLGDDFSHIGDEYIIDRGFSEFPSDVFEESERLCKYISSKGVNDEKIKI